MGIHTEAVQKLYVAYFSRPADVAGLTYWEKIVAAAGGDTSAVSAAFAASGEYQATYAGQTSLQIINTIYQNLFGRDAEPAGLLYWARLLDSNQVTIDSAVADIAQSALGSDAVAYANKVAAATAFTAGLDTTGEILGYAGTRANEQAKLWLSGITTDASLAAATGAVALDASISQIAQAGLGQLGTQYTLTTGIDTVTGTANNDTIVGLVDGANTTLTALDTIDGGAGTDTLEINAIGALSAAPAVSLNSVEIVNVRAADEVRADISGWSGVEQFNIKQASGVVDVDAGATTDVNVTVKSTGAVAVDGGKNVAVKLSDVAVAHSIVVGLNSAAKGEVNLELTGKAIAAGGVNAFGTIVVNGGSSINVTQVATSDASQLVVGSANVTQGIVLVNGDASTTTVNVQQSAAADTVAGVAAKAAVRETATVKFVELASGQALSAGGLTFTAVTDLTAAEVAQAFANLVNGKLPAAGDTQGASVAASGTYSGVFTGWTSSAAQGDTVVFTSTATTIDNVADLAFTGTGAAPAVTTVDGSPKAGKTAVLGVTAGTVVITDTAGTIKSVSLDGYGATSNIAGTPAALEALNLSNSNEDFYVADSAATLALKLENIGADNDDLVAYAGVTFLDAPATLDVTSTDDNFITLTAAQTTALNVAGDGQLGVVVGNLDGLKTVTVSDAAGLDTGATVLRAAVIDASATTGDVSVAIAGDVTAYTGGAGEDNVTVDAVTVAIDKAIGLGAGDDVLDLSALSAAKLAATAGGIVLDGGDGVDTLVLGAADAATLSGTAAFEATISGFEKLELGSIGGGASVNLDNLDDINYVIVDGAASAPVLGAAKVDGTDGPAKEATVTVSSMSPFEFVNIGELTLQSAPGGATLAEVVEAIRTGQSNATVIVSGALDGWTVTDSTLNTVVLTANSFADEPLPEIGGFHTGTFAVTETTPSTPGTNETASFTFADLMVGQGYTVGGRTVMALAGATASEVATAFETGLTTAKLSVLGAVAGWTGVASGSTISYTAAVFGDVTDLAATALGGTGGTLTLAKAQSGATVELVTGSNVEVQLADASGAADVLNIVAKATSTVVADGIETVNVTAGATNTLTLDAGKAKAIVIAGDNAKATQSLTLSADTKSVTSIDASAAKGAVQIASSLQADAVAVTLTGGAGNDILTSLGSKADVLMGGGGDDMLIAGAGMTRLTGGEGNDLFKIAVASQNVNSYATITDFGAGDLIQFVGAAGFTSVKVELGDTAVFQDYANAVVNTLAAGQAGWFQFQGNTYVVADMGANSTAGFVDGQDFIVKLTGIVDLEQASFNTSEGTIGLV